MIKTTAKNNSVETTEYPKLMIQDHKKYIVLMSRSGEGMVVHSSNRYYPVGYYSASWTMLRFTDYTGEVTIASE